MGPEQNLANGQTHGIDFDEAQEYFRGLVFTAPDNRMDYGEERLISIRLINGVVVVVHTERDGRTRIVSARKANRKERQTYNDQLEKTQSRN